MAVVSCVWGQIKSIGDVPCARFGHSVVQDDENVYLFGGSRITDKAQFEYFNDLYQASPKNNSFVWEKMHIPGLLPQSRDCHSMCLVDGHIYVFGGKNEFSSDRCLPEVYSYDINEKRWNEIKTSGPSPQAIGFSASLVKKRVFTFGGILKGQAVQDTFIFNLDKCEWTPVKCSGALPEPRCDHGCEAVDDIIYVFGGTGGFNHYYNDIYSFETATFAWTKVKNKGFPPNALAGHSFVAHRDKDIYVYGGYGMSEESSCGHLVYKFSIGSKKWKQPLTAGISPPTIHLHGHSSIVLHSTMYLFGGIGIEGEAGMDAIFTLRLINPSFRKPVIEHMLTDFCKQSNSLSCWLPTTKPNVSYTVSKPKELKQSIASFVKTNLSDTLPLSTRLVKEEFDESEDLEAQKSLFRAARTELAQAKQCFENDKIGLIRLLELETKEAEKLVNRHRKQNETWWNARTTENDLERAKLRLAWEEIKAEKEQLSQEREGLQAKAKQVSHLLQQLT